MPLSSVDSFFKTWRISQCPFSIEYPSALFEQIHNEVERARTSTRGGQEVGGVLFGIPEPERVRIVSHRPIDCEHAMGPGFVLSEEDQKRLEQLILAPASDPQLNGLQALGWYHSHITSRIFLSELDRKIQERHFGAACQIALVIRPSSDQPMRAAFFFRESTGEMHTDSGYEEFTIEAPATLPEIRPPAPPEEKRSRWQVSTAPTVRPHGVPICPRCGSKYVRRSRRSGLIEAVRGLAGFYPYRCHECLSRSFLKNYRLLEHVRSSPRKRPEERRRSLIRTRREVLLWGGGILGFLAILVYLIRDTGSGPEQP